MSSEPRELHIAGVTWQEKPIFPDERGEVRQFVTAGRNGRIGEVYFSTVRHGVLKGYHLHKRMTLRYTCVLGAVLVGLADARPDSPTFGETMVWPLASHGPHHGVLTIPPGIWNGFRLALPKELFYGEDPFAIICNAASHRHSRQEILRTTVEEVGIEILGPDFQVQG